MKIVIRTDASIQIGTGHVMRCLTLADALSKKGCICHFICREHTGHLYSLIEDRGHGVFLLPASDKQLDTCELNLLAHSDWLGVTQEDDQAECIPLLQSLDPDWLIVDHYALDHRWQSKLRRYCKNIMVIDDLADRHHDCNLLLDQTFDRDPLDYQPLVPKNCKIFCGSRYALLRPEFSQWREYSLKRRQHGKLEHILINLGGVDKDNITSQVLVALRQCLLPTDCKITVVMGATAPWIEFVRKEARKLHWKTEVRVDVSNMAELMSNSDLAIGAAGATSWERCCLGLPAVMMVLAENQQMIAKKLQDAGACVGLSIDNLHRNLSNVLNDLITGKLAKFANKASEITDGQGVDHLIKYIKAER
ncbi:UDP-2,4-diacetamido-2,4,6-trideoxy-beta-L-altropyranose hydrolase [Nitrincola iocasae]|uniref:UDP-2,4-diacetamido-2,4, 6-trideoxy-beta-L-altropyranose hydrolase n=1 Tax=Nitrincola iocasae TaxID=2614693 RepID=A0A5J6LBH8_9GAMM|nr:UDP-2,4-diacetamido-2,4,6-trideoxy-beta-L-altropyranose hydrolase [Nitrincola iocasae]QEW05925.1 UDP-2,4-diacetamido-2,4,6-trideoxy-beta-L-altropyranose hydrolase [Nitrincola iocasae]